MSWSYYKTGGAAVVRKDAAEKLESAAKSCEHIPAEAAGVRAFAQAVDAACSQAEGQALRVEGSGSAWQELNKLKSYTFTVKIEVIDLTS